MQFEYLSSIFLNESAVLINYNQFKFFKACHLWDWASRSSRQSSTPTMMLHRSSTRELPLSRSLWTISTLRTSSHPTAGTMAPTFRNCKQAALWNCMMLSWTIRNQLCVWLRKTWCTALATCRDWAWTTTWMLELEPSHSTKSTSKTCNLLTTEDPTPRTSRCSTRSTMMISMGS